MISAAQCILNHLEYLNILFSLRKLNSLNTAIFWTDHKNFMMQNDWHHWPLYNVFQILNTLPVGDYSREILLLAGESSLPRYKFCFYLCLVLSFLVAQLVKNLSAMRDTWVQSLGWEDPLEKGKATHSSILAW